MSSFFSRISNEINNVGDAFNDAYGNLVYGDDAGKSAKLVFIANPKIVMKRKSSIFYHGMTFIEVNERAYVRSVDPNSDAFKAGVKPRDCVQLALVLGEALDHLKNNNGKAAKYGLECEKDGLRTSCAQLKNIIGESCFAEHLKELNNKIGQEEYYTQSSFINITPDKSRSDSPSASVKIRHGLSHILGNCVGKTSLDDTIAHDDTSAQSELLSSPILFVLRRTRQREPNKPSSSTGLISFRLDDECDRAADFVHRLANTRMNSSSPNKSRSEIFYDGKNWFLPLASSDLNRTDILESEDCIKLSNEKIDNLRSVKLTKDINTEESSKQQKRPDEIETKAIRALIQSALGLAFIRTSKFVLGVSLNAGSGIIIARLPDGTWSPPSAIGMMGAGLGLQFGLEVVDYIFILQTRQSLDNFRKGGHFTVGGNIGAAVAGLGREAYGAASLGGSLCSPITSPEHGQYEDANHDLPPPEGMAEFSHVMAYAKSQGLYFGVSLEGNRIYTRNDINCRSYKFSTGKSVHAHDVLDGKVPTPSEAENLYASLHSLEYNHEISDIPRPPTFLREHFCKDWNRNQTDVKPSNKRVVHSSPFSSSLADKEALDSQIFEHKMKDFLFGGVSVLRLIPGSEDKSGMTRCQRRTLWLMEPAHGALRIGFISKGAEEGISSRQDRSQNDHMDNDEKNYWSGEQHNIFLSKKNSIALTDIVYLGQNPNFPIRFYPDDDTDHLRIISIVDISGNCLLFIPDSMRVSELIVYGLKLLREKEVSRLGVKGGLSLSQFEEKNHSEKSAISPATSRGLALTNNNNVTRALTVKNSSSSENEDEEDWASFEGEIFGVKQITNKKIPEGKRSWAKVPARNFLRDQASKTLNDDNKFISNTDETLSNVLGHSFPEYDHDQQIVRDIALNVKLPVPLHHGRVLLLDSTSPVLSLWEKKIGDKSTLRERWRFSKDSNRNDEIYNDDSKLIADCNMANAYRHVRYECSRNGEIINLTETQTVDADDKNLIKLNVREHLPRRGFSVNVHIQLHQVSLQYCDASVIAKVCPLGKSLPSQVIANRLLLLLSEINLRYGKDESGFLACFLGVARKISYSAKNMLVLKDSKVNFAAVSCDHTNHAANSISIVKETSKQKKTSRKESKHSRKARKSSQKIRPGTPSLGANGMISDASYKEDMRKKYSSNSFAEIPNATSSEAKGSGHSHNFLKAPTIAVKPLPKIRLDLMPSPREEDEYQSNLDGIASKLKNKNHRSKSRYRLGNANKKNLKRTNA